MTVTLPSDGRIIAAIGRDREKIMRLDPHEFIWRFLLHVSPMSFHRMRHFRFLADSHRRDRIGLCREFP